MAARAYGCVRVLGYKKNLSPQPPSRRGTLFSAPEGVGGGNERFEDILLPSPIFGEGPGVGLWPQDKNSPLFYE